MKALVKSKAEEGIWMEEVPVPECGHNDVLIKVKKTAICGTDIHIYNWDSWAQQTIPVPMVVGHEFVGTIEKMGGEVQGLALAIAFPLKVTLPAGTAVTVVQASATSVATPSV